MVWKRNRDFAGSVFSIRFLADPRYLVAAGEDRNLRIFEHSSIKKVNEFELPEKGVVGIRHIFPDPTGQRCDQWNR